MFTFDSQNSEFINSMDLLIKFIGGVGTLVIFGIGLKRYKKDQTWRKNEFVAQEIKSFNNDPKAQNAMWMLDWKARKIELFPDKYFYHERSVLVNRQILTKALIYHKELKGVSDDQEKFTEIEQAIRDTFDRFLSYFERFEQFTITGMIKPNEIQPYIQYWINKISINEQDNENEKIFKKTLYKYIDKYEFSGTKKLFQRFNENIFKE